MRVRQTIVAAPSLLPLLKIASRSPSGLAWVEQYSIDLLGKEKFVLSRMNYGNQTGGQLDGDIGTKGCGRIKLRRRLRKRTMLHKDMDQGLFCIASTPSTHLHPCNVFVINRCDGGSFGDQKARVTQKL